MVPVLWPSVTYNPYFMVTISTSNNSKMVYIYNIYRAILTTADQYKSYDLSNGTVFNDLERPLPPVSRSLHFLTLNISEIVRDTGSFNGILILTHALQWHEASRSLSATSELLVYVRYYSLWHYRLSMYFSSHASLLVYLIACAFGLLCFIRCFLV